MSKKLLLFATLILSITASGQLKKHPQLQKENVDFKSITDPNYFLYKLVTTMPSSPVREIDSKYVLHNFNWNDVLKTSYQSATRLIAILNDSLTMREPLPDENPNFIYLSANIPTQLLPLIMMTKYEAKIENIRNSCKVTEIKNLYDSELRFSTKFVDSSRKPILPGGKCEVITRYNDGMETVNFTIAIELANAKFTDISSGTIDMQFAGFKEVEKTIIKKSDVGKGIVFYNIFFDVLAFENGVLHLRYKKQYEKPIDTIRKDFKYIGNIDGNKFNIQCDFENLIYAVYVKYRDDPKLSLEKFQKNMLQPSRVKVDVDDMGYNVMIYHFGYDLDSLNLYNTERQSTTFARAISLRKNGENYSFNNIFAKKNIVNTNLTMAHVAKVQNFFRQNVAYPHEAIDMGIGGTVSFKFTLSPDGVISDVVILSSPHESFSREVRRVATKVPKFKSDLTHSIISSMSLTFRL